MHSCFSIPRLRSSLEFANCSCSPGGHFPLATLGNATRLGSPHLSNASALATKAVRGLAPRVRVLSVSVLSRKVLSGRVLSGRGKRGKRRRGRRGTEVDVETRWHNLGEVMFIWCGRWRVDIQRLERWVPPNHTGTTNFNSIIKKGLSASRFSY